MSTDVHELHDIVGMGHYRFFNLLIYFRFKFIFTFLFYIWCLKVMKSNFLTRKRPLSTPRDNSLVRHWICSTMVISLSPLKATEMSTRPYTSESCRISWGARKLIRTFTVFKKKKEKKRPLLLHRFIQGGEYMNTSFFLKTSKNCYKDGLKKESIGEYSRRVNRD